MTRDHEDEVITAILSSALTPRLVDTMDGIYPTREDYRCALAAWVITLLRSADRPEWH